MTISSINSNSSMMLGSMKNAQRPDASKMAEDLFSKLDTTGKGYIEKSDLASALSKVSGSSSSNSSSSDSVDAMFSKLDNDSDGKVTQAEMSATLEKIASQLDGPFPRMRLQGDQGGGMPPSPPPTGSQGTQKSNSTDSSNSSSQDTDPADTNGDGTVSAQEAMAYAQSQSESATTSNGDAQLMQMLAGMPPPQNGGQDDQGFTKDQLTAMVKENGSTDNQRSQVMSDIASNFETADSNGDGRVNGSEARAFEESKSMSSTSSSTNSPSAAVSDTSDAQFLKQMMDLLHAYSGFDQSAENSKFSASA